jgi:hypothetical protein
MPPNSSDHLPHCDDAPCAATDGRGTSLSGLGTDRPDDDGGGGAWPGPNPVERLNALPGIPAPSHPTPSRAATTPAGKLLIQRALATAALCARQPGVSTATTPATREHSAPGSQQTRSGTHNPTAVCRRCEVITFATAAHRMEMLYRSGPYHSRAYCRGCGPSAVTDGITAARHAPPRSLPFGARLAWTFRLPA